MLATLNILIIEDNESDADLIVRALKKAELTFISKIVQDRVHYELALQDFKPDLILSDYSLPSFDAVTAFKIKQAHHRNIPFIIVSGIIGEENAVELIKDGVTDYVSKQNLFTLATKINRALNDVKAKNEKILTDDKLMSQTAELIFTNKELQNANDKLVKQDHEVKTINLELSALNQELETRVARRTLALAESENRFRSMMETIPQIAWTNTLQGEVIFYNQRWFDYTGLDEEKTTLLALKSVIHPDDLNEGLNQFNLILDSKSGGEFQVRAKRADGNFRWHLIRLMPIFAEQVTIQLWVGTATDIQELRLLQQHKDDFIGIASHELKTPLTSLKASLQLLDKVKNNPAAKMLPILIDQANKNVNKIYVLIEDLLNASMANEGQLNINLKTFIIGDLLAEYSRHIHAEGSYKIVTKGDLTTAVYADEIRVEQVIVNFVNNAIKYAPESKEFIIEVKKSSKWLKIAVTDQGKGIASEKLPHLFDRYYRVANHESSYAGLGIGLYICSEIVKKHKGQIGVTSELGVGSTFWFTLPI